MLSVIRVAGPAVAAGDDVVAAGAADVDYVVGPEVVSVKSSNAIVTDSQTAIGLVVHPTQFADHRRR